jgi:ABC-2 type transport system permease protein
VLRMVLLLKWKSFLAQLQYSESFVIQIASVSLIGFLRVPGLLILTRAFGTVGGWGLWDLVLLAALVQMAHGLHHALFFRFFLHRQLLHEGEFDRILARPLHPIWQMIGGSLPMAAVGEFLPGLLLLVAAASGRGLSWSLSDLAFLCLVVLSGATIEGAFNIIFATFDFWLEQTSLMWLPTAFLEAPARYPVHIYAPFLTFVLTFVFPFAFIAYYPAHHFLDRAVPIYGQSLAYLSPLVACVLLSLAVGFWSVGLRHYRSTGS